MTKGKNIKVYGVPETTDGILRPIHLRIEEDGEILPRVQEFAFTVNVNGLPHVHVVSLPETIEIDIGNVQVGHDIDHTRIFTELKDVLLLMDYAFRSAWRTKKDSWKISSLEYLKDKMDKAYVNLFTVMAQNKTGERDIVDVSTFAVKIANYAMMIADRAKRIQEEERAFQEEKVEIDRGRYR